VRQRTCAYAASFHSSRCLFRIRVNCSSNCVHSLPLQLLTTPTVVNGFTNEDLHECANTFFYWVTDTDEVGKSEPLEAVLNSSCASLQLQSYTAVIFFFFFILKMTAAIRLEL